MRNSKERNTDKQKRSPFQRFLFHFSTAVMIALTIIIALLLLLSAKASWLNPSKALLSNFPNYVFLPLALANVLMLFYWIFRWNAWAFLPLALMILTFGDFKTWLPIHFKAESIEQGKSVKLLTYNTMQFSKLKKPRKDRPNPVLDYLAHCDADILCLQEADFSNITSSNLSKAEILSSLSQYPFQCNVYYSHSNERGLWVFSKYPLSQPVRIKYPSTYNASFYCDVDIDGTMVRLFNNHLESYRLTAQDKEKYKAVHDKDTFMEAAHTLGGKLARGASARSVQAQAVQEQIKQSPYPVIVCGDFNDIPNSYTYRMIHRNLTDAWTAHSTGLGITFHEKIYRFRIDYILHSPSLQSFGTEVDHVPYSDHYPLWTHFQINQKVD